MDEVYLKYYVNQAGSGVGHFYSGPIYQRGYGVGSFLGGLFRSVLPILKKGSLALGRELVSCGTNVMNDIEDNVPADIAILKHGKQAVSNLKKKVLNMSGGGYKGVKKPNAKQSRTVSQTVRSKKKKPNKSKKVVKNKDPKPNNKKKLKKLLTSVSDIFSSKK